MHSITFTFMLHLLFLMQALESYFHLSSSHVWYNTKKGGWSHNNCKWQIECSIYRLVLEIDALLILVQAKALTEKVHEVIRSEEKATKKLSYTVSGVLSSSGSSTSRSDNLQELLGATEKYSVYKFKTR